MSSTNDVQHITGLCVPDGTRNGKPVWKLMDERNPHNLFTKFRKELPEEGKTRDFHWTAIKKECKCKYCYEDLIYESDLIPTREGVYTVKLIGQTTSKSNSNTVEIKCPFVAHNMFLNMVKQFNNKSTCYNSGTFVISVIYTYKGKEYYIAHCSLLGGEFFKFYEKYPVKNVKKNETYMFRHVDMTFFNDDVNIIRLSSQKTLVFDEHNKMIINY